MTHKIIKLGEVKAEKKGRVTPEALVKHLQGKLDDVEAVVYVVIKKDGEISIGYSEGSLVSFVGLLEVAKQEIAQELVEFI